MKQLISPIFKMANPIKIHISNKPCVLEELRNQTLHRGQELHTCHRKPGKCWTTRSFPLQIGCIQKVQSLNLFTQHMFPGRRAPGSPRTSCTPAQDKLLAWFTRVFYLVNSRTPCRTMPPWTVLPGTPIVQLTPVLESIPSYSLFSFRSLPPVRHPMITLNNSSSSSAHVSSRVPGSSIPPGRLYIACSWASPQRSCSPILSSFLSSLWTFFHLFISLCSPNDKSNPYK